MSITKRQAEKLCTKAELELFVSSLPTELKPLTRAKVFRKVQSARRLRDKQQDLLRRQRLASREKSGAKDGKSGAANARTEHKVVLFTEALARFEKRLEQLDNAAAKAAAQAEKAAAKAAKKAAKPAPAAPKSTSKATRPAPLAVAKDKRLAKSNIPRQQAHSASRNRRDQGRKDNRG
ncbi:MAG: hypothetical protein M9913_05765 [Bryobacteraceae bacterium]|nr:hypothetical protein [Solibacteraceae bacterium]MCO5350397.1 hypothetical protein [Bryobacteraceae bacterium]